MSEHAPVLSPRLQACVPTGVPETVVSEQYLVTKNLLDAVAELGGEAQYSPAVAREFYARVDRNASAAVRGHARA
eukprot:2095101-Pyramimonas_sp.AAC.1